MTNIIKISHSGKTTFNECPAKFDLHYNKKIRAVYESSPLFFGNACDEALNVLLLKKKKVLTDEEKLIADSDIYEVFDQYFTYKEIANEKIDLRTDLKANYYGTDYHPAFMEDSDYKILEEWMATKGYEETCPKKLREALLSSKETDGWQGIDLVDRSFLNYNTWLSLRRKGFAMLDSYKKELYPKIVEVISIQRKVYIEGDGVAIRGLVDFEAILDDGKRYTVDNKTSSKPYKQDSVETSPQLATYNYETQHGNAAYFILLKKPKETKVKTCQICQNVTEGREKTCKVEHKYDPENGNKVMTARCNGEFSIEVRVEMKCQEVRGTISSELEDETLGEYEVAVEAIETGNFPENREGKCYSYGQKCQYYSLCRDGSMTGLKDLSDD